MRPSSVAQDTGYKMHISSVSQPVSAVAQSCLTLCDPHGPQHARLPRPSPTPGACSNSGPSSWWCHPTTSSSIVPFSSHLQSFPTAASFPMSRLFASGGQSTGVSVSASAKLNIQDWFPLGLTGWISFRCIFQVWFGAYTCSGIAAKKIKLSLENIFFLVRSQVFGKKYVRSLCWKVSWSRKWLSTPVFFPAKSHGQRSLAGYS